MGVRGVAERLKTAGGPGDGSPPGGKKNQKVSKYFKNIPKNIPKKENNIGVLK